MKDRGSITIEFVLMLIVPISAILLFYMMAVHIGGLKAVDEAAREAARTYARYAGSDDAQARSLAVDMAKNAFNAKAPPGAKLISVSLSRTPQSAYDLAYATVTAEVKAPFVGTQKFQRTYAFPTELYRRKEALF